MRWQISLASCPVPCLDFLDIHTLIYFNLRIKFWDRSLLDYGRAWTKKGKDWCNHYQTSEKHNQLQHPFCLFYNGQPLDEHIDIRLSLK